MLHPLPSARTPRSGKGKGKGGELKASRSQYYAIIEQYLNGVSANYSWTHWDGPDVLFGGGAENWTPNPQNGNTTTWTKWQDRGYSFVTNNVRSRISAGLTCADRASEHRRL